MVVRAKWRHFASKKYFRKALWWRSDNAGMEIYILERDRMSWDLSGLYNFDNNFATDWFRLLRPAQLTMGTLTYSYRLPSPPVHLWSASTDRPIFECHTFDACHPEHGPLTLCMYVLTGPFPSLPVMFSSTSRLNLGVKVSMVVKSTKSHRYLWIRLAWYSIDWDLNVDPWIRSLLKTIAPTFASCAMPPEKHSGELKFYSQWYLANRSMRLTWSSSHPEPVSQCSCSSDFVRRNRWWRLLLYLR